MKSHLCILTTILIAFCILKAQAQTSEDNILINKKISSFSFDREKEGIVVNEKNAIYYECSKWGETYTMTESYNNKTKLTDIDRKGRYSSKPEYKLYTSDNMFYTDLNICYIDLYFERKGATNELKFKKKYLDPRYFTIIPLSDDLFIKEMEVTVRVPQWMNVELLEYSIDKNISKNISIDPKSQDRIYSYKVINQPAEKRESNMRGYTQTYPHIQVICKSANIDGEKVTFFETLNDQYAWYHNIVKDVNNDMTIIRTKAKEITKDSKTDEEKIKSLFAWVQDNIRYIAFEDGLAAFKPDDAQEVLRKKYGDCKGMANLTKALLQSEGFDARLAWLGTNHIAYDYTTPSLSNDNHMICALFFKGKTYYLDATVKYIPLGEYSHHIQGRQTLVEDKDNSEYLLNRIPVFPSLMNTDSLYSEIHVDGDILQMKSKHYYMGESKQILLSLMDATPKDKLNSVLKVFLENNSSQSKADDIQIRGASSQSQEVEICYNLETKEGLQSIDNEYYIDLDLQKDFSNNNINIEKRVHDIDFSYHYYVVRQTVLNIPQGYKITSIPKDLRIEREGYTFSIEYKQQDNRLIYKKIINIPSDYLKKDSFNQWNDDISSLRKAYMEQVTLTKIN
ncbi:transglutaminase family protein [Dysgonomonas sp. BGC7]|uniref:transglutaminase-like domain-containing protein n=1 Tax=Dysgonomonas sp. BGC7 TaxID=1658008 RepID=UPI000680783B|nr:transglutaminase domain-containing protein [Dysgonomonas sp. BGC7]MBD8388765.1 transglutaminase domain-containing protein [Dysgonomonas sp. BGC7]